MLKTLKLVAYIFFYIISKVFIIIINIITQKLQYQQDKFVVDEKNQHYIRNKIVTSSKRSTVPSLRGWKVNIYNK